MDWRPTHRDVFVYALQKLRDRLLLASVEKESLHEVFDECERSFRVGPVVYMGTAITMDDFLVFNRLIEIESTTPKRRRAA